MYAAKQAGGGVVAWGSEGMRALRRGQHSEVVLSTSPPSSPSSTSSAILSALGGSGRE